MIGLIYLMIIIAIFSVIQTLLVVFMAHRHDSVSDRRIDLSKTCRYIGHLYHRCIHFPELAGRCYNRIVVF